MLFPWGAEFSKRKEENSGCIFVGSRLFLRDLIIADQWKTLEIHDI